ncbi:hypothetical protein B0H16DRAFT_1370195, partial [Mycena metata]
MSVLPPAKRQRTDDASRSSIWYSDGSVVLQAEDTQFRVHWSLLAQHSSFFRDMQALPQPPGQPSVEGCPIVELYDSAKDVAHLLTVLYNPDFAYQKAVPFEVVAALIRLGRKYEFRGLLDSAVERVTCEHPTTLEEYDALHGEDCLGPYHFKSVVDYLGIEFDVLALVRENNIMTALPCAYHRILKYPHKQLFEGIDTGDALVTLSPLDQKLCSLGREKIIAAQMLPGFTLGWLCKWGHNSDCLHPAKCYKMREKALQLCFMEVNVRILNPTPFAFTSMCMPCTRHIQELVSAGRKKAWEQLPTFFDLPSWEELKND